MDYSTLTDEELESKVLALWAQAMEAQGCPPDTKFAIMAPDNPVAPEYDKALDVWIKRYSAQLIEQGRMWNR